jgi:hypothetical protein
MAVAVFPRHKRYTSTNGMALWAAQRYEDLQQLHLTRRGFLCGLSTIPLGIPLGAPRDLGDGLKCRLRGGRWHLG